MNNRLWYERELVATVEITDHAWQRQVERGILYKDIVSAIKHGYQRPGTNRYEHRNVIVAVKKIRKPNKFVVITVFRPGETE